MTTSRDSAHGQAVDEAPGPSNAELADALDEIGELLERRHASSFKVQAYRRAADTVRRYALPLTKLARTHGAKALDELPAIGKGIGAVLMELAETGNSKLLTRLEAEVPPEDLFASLPVIGPRLARRLVSELGIRTLIELERAANSGRLATVAGFGPRRTTALRAMLRRRFSPARRVARWLRGRGALNRPPSVVTLLQIDGEYRRLAEEGQLQVIAPRENNPTHEAWLPIWRSSRDGYHFSVHYSNSELAHRAGKTKDWVVIIYERGGVHGEATVVTETRGKARGRRVVRGREDECAKFAR